jgi:hypothetical protein
MKAITLWQPWATLIAIGAKRIETRSWSTTYHGDIAIHAAKNIPQKEILRIMRMTRDEEPFKSVLDKAGYYVYNSLPRGCVVAIATLVVCIPTNKIPSVSLRESAFGDFSENRFGWMLENIRPLKNPIQAKGAQGLWEWNATLCPRCEGKKYDKGSCLEGKKYDKGSCLICNNTGIAI